MTDDARRCHERLVDAGLPADTVGDLREVTAIACEKAPYLVTLAQRDVRRLLDAAADPHLRREKPRAVMARELAGVIEACGTTEDALLAGLRAYRARELVRLGARECGLGGREEVGRELAALADVCLDAAITWHDAALRTAHGRPRGQRLDGRWGDVGFCVLALGKHGAEELNFASDIDVLYLYETDEGEAGALSLHEYFTLLARGVTRAIGEVTEDDLVFRVDLRLRPEGSRGPLVNSVDSLERYYEAWGRPWERQALLKARPAAGDLALGELVLRSLEPFVFPRSIGPDHIREVEAMSRRIRVELDRGPATPGPGFDVKLGTGGIRQVEFFVQALQLVHAGKRRELRTRATRPALDRLLFAGLVADRERRALGDAYELLRHVEHLLQLESGRQTQSLPTDFDAYSVLALKLGCADAGELTSLLASHTQRVAELFATLGGEGPAPRPAVETLLDPQTTEPEQRAALDALGFRDLDQAVFELELVRTRPGSPLGGHATAAGARLAPILIEELSASPDPDQALRFLADFTGRTAQMQGIWALLEEHRPLLRLVISLFGTSAYLARLFVEHPELLDMLVLRERGGPRRTPDELSRAIDEMLLDPDDASGDAEAAGNALRLVKGEEVLRTGMADIAGELDELAISERLSQIADACVARTYDQVRRRLAARYPRLAPMVVLALGKYGGSELGYASDLDLVFLYDGDVDDHEAMTRLAQRFTSFLAAVTEEGKLYDVDTRLRPSGRQGMLVSSLEALREYHAESSRTWELQALTKARVACGDPVLGPRVLAEVHKIVYGGPARDPHAVAAEIRAMRAKMEKELVSDAGQGQDIKVGRGGLVDVEFVAQYLQLAYGGGRRELRTPRTMEALERAAAAGLLGEPDRAILTTGYRFLRRLEHKMRIALDRPIHELPADPIELDKLARRLGVQSAAALVRQTRALSEEVRACYDRILTP